MVKSTGGTLIHPVLITGSRTKPTARRRTLIEPTGTGRGALVEPAPGLGWGLLVVLRRGREELVIVGSTLRRRLLLLLLLLGVEKMR